MIKGEVVEGIRLIRVYRVSESFEDFVFKYFEKSFNGEILSFVEVKLNALLDIGLLLL